MLTPLAQSARQQRMLLTSSAPCAPRRRACIVAVQPGSIEAEDVGVPQAPQHRCLLLELVQLCRARALHDPLAQHLDHYKHSLPLIQQDLQGMLSRCRGRWSASRAQRSARRKGCGPPAHEARFISVSEPLMPPVLVLHVTFSHMSVCMCAYVCVGVCNGAVIAIYQVLLTNIAEQTERSPMNACECCFL